MFSEIIDRLKCITLWSTKDRETCMYIGQESSRRRQFTIFSIIDANVEDGATVAAYTILEIGG